jgi:acetyltransferase
MLTDVLSEGGMEVPHLEGPAAIRLVEKLYPGSSTANPIDFLATGTAEQLAAIIDACEHDFRQIDGMVVIFGSSGLFPANPVYDVLHARMMACKKPIYPVLPSVINAHEAIQEFIAKKRVYFPDEVLFGRALCRVSRLEKPAGKPVDVPVVDAGAIRQVIETSADGYLPPSKVGVLLDAAGIPRVPEKTAASVEDARAAAESLGYPLAMKSVGPIHKSDVGGLILNVQDANAVERAFYTLMRVDHTTAVLLQPMISGLELFAGVKKEGAFGHILMCGLGGIFVETIRDIQTALGPIDPSEALAMIRNLKGYALLEGIRNQEGVDAGRFAEILVRISGLVEAAPEISEMDLNPLIGRGKEIYAVDARIRLGADGE